MSVIVLLEQAVAYILQVLGISQLIYGLLQQFGVIINQTAKEHFPFEVQGLALAANNQLADPMFGLAAIKTELDGIGLAITALGNPQQTAQPVTLPAVPPAGYGGPTSSANAAAVWSFVSHDENTQMGTIMDMLSVFCRLCADSLAFPGRLGSWSTYNVDLQAFINDPTTSFPEIRAATILPTHTSILDWLQDIYFSLTWNQLSDGTCWASVGAPSGNALVYVTMTPGEFLWLRALASGIVPGTNVPPVWPGLGGVTLGTPVAIGTSFLVPGPLDGVIIDITGVPYPVGQYVFDGLPSYVKIGGLVFLDDNGDAELSQPLGFQHAILCPQTMAHASSAKGRAVSGVTGTVTPWTLT